MYQITLFIEQLYLTGLVTYFRDKKTRLIVKQRLAVNDIVVATSELQNLLDQLYSYTKGDKAVVRIIIANSDLMQQTLLLPNLALKDDEIAIYVANSLVKLFHTTDALSYDYQLDLNHETKQLHVIAYPEQKLQQLLLLCSPYRVDFIGIPSLLIAHQQDEETIEPFLEELASISTLTGWNFLPWRKRRKQSKQIILFSLILGCMLIFAISFWVIFQQSSERTAQQIMVNQLLNNTVIEKRAELLMLEQLEQRFQQQQANLAQQHQRQKQLITLFESLVAIANNTPNDLWWQGLSYHEQQIKLLGKGFLYADILVFSQSLNALVTLQSNKVVTIKRYGDILQFELDIILISIEAVYEN